MSRAIHMVIELGRVIMSIKSVTKFGDDWTTIILERVRTICVYVARLSQ